MIIVFLPMNVDKNSTDNLAFVHKKLETDPDVLYEHYTTPTL